MVYLIAVTVLPSVRVLVACLSQNTIGRQMGNCRIESNLRLVEQGLVSSRRGQGSQPRRYEALIIRPGCLSGHL